MQRLQDQAGREGNFFRSERGVGLRRDFGKNQHDDGDYHRCQCRAQFTKPVQAQQGCQCGDSIVDEIVADQDDAKQAVRPLQHLFDTQCGAVTLTGKMAQLVAVQRHHAGFAAGEKSG